MSKQQKRRRREGKVLRAIYVYGGGQVSRGAGPVSPSFFALAAVAGMMKAAQRATARKV